MSYNFKLKLLLCTFFANTILASTNTTSENTTSANINSCETNQEKISINEIEIQTTEKKIPENPKAPQTKPTTKFDLYTSLFLGYAQSSFKFTCPKNFSSPTYKESGVTTDTFTKFAKSDSIEKNSVFNIDLQLDVLKSDFDYIFGINSGFLFGSSKKTSLKIDSKKTVKEDSKPEPTVTTSNKLFISDFANLIYFGPTIGKTFANKFTVNLGFLLAFCKTNTIAISNKFDTDLTHEKLDISDKNNYSFGFMPTISLLYKATKKFNLTAKIGYAFTSDKIALEDIEPTVSDCFIETGGIFVWQIGISYKTL